MSNVMPGILLYQGTTNTAEETIMTIVGSLRYHLDCFSFTTGYTSIYDRILRHSLTDTIIPLLLLVVTGIAPWLLQMKQVDFACILGWHKAF